MASPTSYPSRSGSVASRPRSPFSRKSSKQHIVTATVSTHGLATAQSPVTPSLTTSPTNTSIQSSPDGPVPRSAPAFPTPSDFVLPECQFPPPPPPSLSHSAMSEAMQQHSKGPGGLIRKLSGKAQVGARRVHRRSSAQNISRNGASRDSSCGPFVQRRRSGSKVGADLDEQTPNGLPEHDQPLQWESTSQLSRDPSVAPARRYPLSPKHMPELQEQPVIADLLSHGSVLTKVTKRKRKQIMFVLDPQTAKVSWNSANGKFYVDDIEDILMGENARQFREQLRVPVECEQYWFTIIVADRTRSKGRPHKLVHVLAPTEFVFEAWTSTLRDLYEYRRAIMTGIAGPGLNEETLVRKWQIEMERKAKEQPADANDESLDFPSVERICRSLHINCSQSILRGKFDNARPGRDGKLDFMKFRNFVKDLKERKDIKGIYDSLAASSSNGLDYATFIFFLETSQGIDTAAKPLEWEALFKRLTKTLNASTANSDEPQNAFMDLNAFNAFLSSPDNHILSLKSSGEKFDRPLNEYFVASSHNTYLVGRQIADISSTDGYRLALQAGCRCVEIDCWDGKGGRPEVRHIKFTSPVLFSDCISVINKYAFERSPYPLILSLEVHCCASQQQMMVDVMKKEFGSRLLLDPIGMDEHVLPSPEELRSKILVKVKTTDSPTLKSPVEPPSTPTPLASGRRQRSISSPISQTSTIYNSENVTFDSLVPLSSPPSIGKHETPTLRGRSSLATIGVNSTSDDSDCNSPTLASQQSGKKSKSYIIDPLDKLCVYTRGSKFHTAADLENTRYNHIYSISEPSLEKRFRDWNFSKAIERHNTQYFMRTYPSNSRLTSSNFEPIAFWKHGVQMAALNYQTYDEGMQINEAMFASGSDRNGYVLKPQELRVTPTTVRTGPFAGPISPIMDVVTMARIRFSVHLISAQFLECPRNGASDKGPNPYVEVQVYVAEDKSAAQVFSDGGVEGPARDSTSSGPQVRRRSGIIPGNGYNPSFGETFHFEIETKHPELVFIRWAVWNSSDGRNYNGKDAAEATFTAKYVSLGTGYRHVPLSNHNGEQFMFSTLFCNIAKDESRFFEKVQHGPAEKPGRIRLPRLLRKGTPGRKSSFDL